MAPAIGGIFGGLVLIGIAVLVIYKVRRKHYNNKRSVIISNPMTPTYLSRQPVDQYYIRSAV